jgi:hypothetical protein
VTLSATLSTIVALALLLAIGLPALLIALDKWLLTWEDVEL